MSTYYAFWALSLLLAPFARSRAGYFAFLLAVLVFVGLRFETGFDWPAYKGMYERLAGEFSLVQLPQYVTLYNQDPGYILLAGAFASVTSYYEVLQAFITLFFLLSTNSLCKAYRVDNRALALAISLTFLLPTVGFSTARQCLAIGVFNLALVASTKRNPIATWALLALAVTIQVSSLLYVGAFILARVYVRFRGRVPGMVFMAAFTAVTTLSLLLLSQVASRVLPGYVAVKLQYYAEFAVKFQPSALQVAFAVLFVGMAVHACWFASSRNDPTGDLTMLRALIVMLAGMALASSFALPVRDRLSYELFLLFCVHLGTADIRARIQARVAVATFGLAYSNLALLHWPYSIPFVPYQNTIMVIGGAGTDSHERHVIFIEEFNKLNR